MSSAGPTAAAAEKRYFCHQCNRTFTITAAVGTGLACAHCNGDFVEEFDLSYPDTNPNPNPNSDPVRDFHIFDDADAFATIPSLLSALIDLAGAGADPSRENPPSDSGAEPMSPVSALRDLIQTLSLGGPAGGGGGGRHFIGNFGDYFVGPGLEQLIQQLAENDPNRYGTPPASKSAVESLPDDTVTEGMLASDEAQCSVCMDPFEMGTVAKRMPCHHIYHKECILPWLELHNSCPVCRYELPTDDLDYERFKATGSNSFNLGGTSNVAAEARGSGGNSMVQTAERSSGDHGGHGNPTSETH